MTLGELARCFDFQVSSSSIWQSILTGDGFLKKAEFASWGFMHILVMYVEGKLQGGIQNFSTQNLGGKK